MSRLGRVPPFRSKLNLELSSSEILVGPSLDKTRIGFVQVEIDFGSGDWTSGVPSEFNGFSAVDSCASSGGSVEVTSA